MDTLAFGCILPTTGRIWVFHPLETCAAGRTKTKTETALPAVSAQTEDKRGIENQLIPNSLFSFT
jgi:hypothetical protein